MQILEDATEERQGHYKETVYIDGQDQVHHTVVVHTKDRDQGPDRQHDRKSRSLQRDNCSCGRPSRSRSYQKVNSGCARQKERSRSRSSQRGNAGRRSTSLDLPFLVQKPRL